MFQHSHIGFHSTTLEMALSGGYAHRAGWGVESAADIEQAKQALEAVGLQALAEQPLEFLSGGELRRAEIARLLIQKPKLAMLDEPLNHLDIGQQLAMLRLLREQFCTQDHALLLVLHDVNLARRIATHLLLLNGQGRWQTGPVQELGDATNLSACLGYPLYEADTPQGKILEIDYRHSGLAPTDDAG